jgi:hypothetical protein
MGNFDWFGLTFGLLGLLSMLSGCYEWTWLWRLARGGYLPSTIGWDNTRLFYIVTGAFELGVGIAFTLQSILSVNSIWFFFLSFALAIVLTVILYNSRGNQSILELVAAVGRGKSKHEKKKNEEDTDSEQ